MQIDLNIDFEIDMCYENIILQESMGEQIMKRVLIISNEDTRDNNGKIMLSGQLGLGEDMYDIPNLIQTIQDMGDYQVIRIHHTQVSEITAFSPDYVILSGRFSAKAMTSEEILSEFQEEIDWIKHTSTPTLGICMGLQLICAAFGVETIPLDFSIGEYGFTELKAAEVHPQLGKLPDRFWCMEMHRCQAARVPEGFCLMATSKECRVQMIAHQSRPIMATQFHPELMTSEHRDGLLIIKPFFEAY